MLKKSPFLLYCLQALDDSHPFKITEFLIGQFPFFKQQRLQVVSVDRDAGRDVLYQWAGLVVS